MKKLLALILALSLVLGSMSFAFAATPSDVVGKDSEGAVVRLMGLGIIKGYDDGTFKPDATITRAEFAAVVIRALGLEAASKSGVKTVFTDVPSTHWASGYVSLATGLKIINGYGDGKFGPSDPVTYEQAITMVLRAMGYEPLANKLGGYPAGYIVVAANEGISKGIAGSVGTPANRGTVAKIIDQSLEKDFYGIDTVTEDGKATYKKLSGVNFLSKLGNSVDTTAFVVATKSVDNDLGSKEFKVAGGAKKEAVEGVDVESFLGKEVKLWKNSSGKIIFGEIKTASDKVIAVKEVKAASASAIQIVNAADETKTYDYAANNGAVLNFGTTTVGAVATELAGKGKELYKVTVTLDGDGKAAFVNAVVYNTAGIAADTVNNTVSKNTIVKLGTKYYGETEIYVQKDGKNPLMLKIEKNGAAAAATDIKSGDFIAVAYAKGSDIEKDRIYIVATDNKVTGKFEAAAPTLSDVSTATIAGKSYSLSGFNSGIKTQLGGLALTKDIKVTLDHNGKIVKAEAVTAADTSVYGAAKAKGSDTVMGTTTYWAKILTASGDEKTFVVKESSEYDKITTPALIKYTLDADGKISSVTAYASSSAGMKLDKAKAKIGDQYFKSTSSVVIYQVTGSAVTLRKWADLTDATTYTAIYRNTTTAGAEIEAIMLNNDDTAFTSTSSDKFAIVTSKSQFDTTKFDVTVMTKGGSVALKAESGFAPVKKDVVKYKLDSNGKIASGASSIAAITTAAIVVESVDTTLKYIKDSNGTRYYYTDDTVFLFDKDEDGDGVEVLTAADIVKYTEVKLYNADGDTDASKNVVLVKVIKK